VTRTTEQEQWVAEHVRLLSLKMSHHASASGYDRLGDYLNCPTVQPFAKSGLIRKYSAKLVSPLIRNSGSLWYNRTSALQELDAAIASASSGNRRAIFHFLYGENCYRYFNAISERFRSRRASIATYHTTPQRFYEVVTNRKHISRLDMAIVMSNVQKPLFEGVLPADRVRFIPHGVDTDYFFPLESKPINAASPAGDSPVRYFCAGQMQRDYPTLVEAAAILAGRKTPVTIVIVAKPEVTELFRGLDNVETHSGVSNETLLALYQSSDALVMPLKDCTANNVLLEGLACGLGVVATDLQGVRDYTSEPCRDLVEPKNAEALAQAMLDLASDPERRVSMGKAARQQAMELSWPTIAKQHVELYQEIGAFH